MICLRVFFLCGDSALPYSAISNTVESRDKEVALSDAKEGEEDRIVGVQASYEMKELIADSRLVVYPGLGHAAYEEAPDFNETVFQFLRDHIV